MIFPQVRIPYNIISRDIINQIFCDAILSTNKTAHMLYDFSVEASPTNYGLQKN